MAIKFSKPVEQQEFIQTVGSYLQSVRVNNNLSINEVSERTKIKKHFIVAIESDTLADVMDIQYARIHIINIARFIKADIQKAIELYVKQYNLEDKKSNPSIKKSNGKKDYERKILIPKLFFKISALVIIAAVVFIVGYNLHKKGILQRDIFENPPEEQPKNLEEVLQSNDDYTETYSYKKEDFYKKYILKDKEVPWHVFPKYMKPK
ncbi:MAG TPA: hypothetical protein ENK03_01270 [Candidatus Cloacimonetes bacterium]|nr:hypothetical protein [Candidatus Cloacimonadota bacterium]